jgi:hypothetical protein
LSTVTSATSPAQTTVFPTVTDELSPVYANATSLSTVYTSPAQTTTFSTVTDRSSSLRSSATPPSTAYTPSIVTDRFLLSSLSSTLTLKETSTSFGATDESHVSSVTPVPSKLYTTPTPTVHTTATPESEYVLD